MSDLTRKEEQILLAVHFLKENAYLITIQAYVQKYTGKNYSVGTIYAPLNRLYLNGYLETCQGKTSESNKPIRYYKLTPKGYQALVALKELTDAMWEGFSRPAFE